MKAATTQGFATKTVLVVDETDEPKLGENDVLVEVYASSVNPKDWKINKNISAIISAMAHKPNKHPLHGYSNLNIRNTATLYRN